MDDYLDYLIETLYDILDENSDEIMECLDPEYAVLSFMDRLPIEENIELDKLTKDELTESVLDWLEDRSELLLEATGPRTFRYSFTSHPNAASEIQTAMYNDDTQEKYDLMKNRARNEMGIIKNF